MTSVTIVTGGSRGIGAATCRLLAKAGHRVAVGYRSDHAAARAVVAGLETESIAVRVDTTDSASVRDLFDTAERELGRITGLVNNAGVGSPAGPFTELSEQDLRHVVDVNLIGYVLCAQQAARRGVAAIVNVSSAAATLGSPNEYVHYAATKAATDTLTVGLARELGPRGIRVNTVSPGIIHTGFHAGIGDPDRPNRLASRSPMGRSGRPEEVAAAIVWLLGDEASYVNGANLRVSGGL
ncbi:SDR family NAD(P)-dependent oxidoreductase [Allorhizocola rhizosphaerae]|uniref:SDR family NAD(P)-dependent oxidoreductase n=1 Tax=Allorhizocola rhizosphaerae TaxID=1872709 RepID=UPI000E3D59B2|nr:SDR family oxidoreductase [Allorhizocola rhizosphaerae]